MTLKLISRKDAKAKGLLRYFTGKLCKHGHIAERLVSIMKCVECNREYIKANRQTYYPPAKTHQDYLKHKAKRLEKNAVWATNNPDKVKAIHKRWRERNPNKIKANHDRWREENPDKDRAKLNNWRRRNPAAYRMQKYRRRMLEATADGIFTETDLTHLLEQQTDLCIGCNADITTTFTVDHKTPLSRGGSNDPANLQLLCKSCNSSKGTKTNEEWRAS